MRHGRNGADRLWRGLGDLTTKTENTLTVNELRILQAVAGQAHRNLRIQGPNSPPAGMHETALVEKTGIPLDELMTLRRDEYDRIRRSGIVQNVMREATGWFDRWRSKGPLRLCVDHACGIAGIPPGAVIQTGQET